MARGPPASLQRSEWFLPPELDSLTVETNPWEPVASSLEPLFSTTVREDPTVRETTTDTWARTGVKLVTTHTLSDPGGRSVSFPTSRRTGGRSSDDSDPPVRVLRRHP